MVGLVDLPATFTTSQARQVGMQYRDLYRAVWSSSKGQTSHRGRHVETQPWS